MKRIVYWLLAATLLVSCHKGQETEVVSDSAVPTVRGLVIMAESTPLSKTDIDQGASSWEYGDSISVIYDGQVYIYRTLQTGDQVTFTSENGIRDYDESKGIIAYYPPVAIDEVIGVPATREISFIGDGQVNAAKVPLVGVAADEVSPDGSLRMSFSNICSVIEFRIDAGDVAEGIRTFKVEPASETGFEGYLSFTGTVDPETLAISPATTGNSITLTLPDGASLNRPLTLKVPVGRFTSPSGLKLTVENPFGTSDSRVVYATGIQSYSVEDGIYSVKHFAKPLYPFSTLAVDLGLSVLWGTCNLGTTTVGEKGGSYVWQGWTTDLGKLGANWRMPTISEFDELRLNCSWERFSINGINGIKGTSLVEGYTDKWIILPDEDYWSSSLGISSNSYQGITVENSTTGNYIATMITDGGNYYLRVRPVYVYGGISVSSISVNPTTLTLNVGASSTLTANIQPSNVTNNSVTWSSSNTSVATVSSSGNVTAVAKGTATITVKANDGSGKSATCSVTVKQPVTGITLNKTSLTLKVEGSETLTATVSPSTANNRSVTWTSSNTSVATVSSTGKVTAVAKGTATITVKAKDGSGKSASCSVTVSKSGIKAVDLGLSSGVKWAACNVNANSPEANGSYYAWAEISPKSDYSYDKYKWLTFDLYSDETVYSKYRVVATSYGMGTLAPDGKKTLELEDDAARTVMEDNWRMPTKAEMEELINSCTWTWTTVNNVKGYKVASKKSGNTNYIFLPAIGYKSGTSLKESGSTCAYWTSSLGTTNEKPYSLKGTSSTKAIESTKLRYYGMPVRAVCK